MVPDEARGKEERQYCKNSCRFWLIYLMGKCQTLQQPWYQSQTERSFLDLLVDLPDSESYWLHFPGQTPALTLTLTANPLNPAQSQAEEWNPPSHTTPPHPLLTASLAAFTRGSGRMEHSETLMTQRYREPQASSRQPLPANTFN